MEQILQAVTKHAHFGKKPLGVKLAPYFDMPHFERACDILARYPLAFVVCINTIGNALFIDADKECAVITPKGGYGGLGASRVGRLLRLLLAVPRRARAARDGAQRSQRTPNARAQAAATSSTRRSPTCARFSRASSRAGAMTRRRRRRRRGERPRRVRAHPRSASAVQVGVPLERGRRVL